MVYVYDVIEVDRNKITKYFLYSRIIRFISRDCLFIHIYAIYATIIHNFQDPRRPNQRSNRSASIIMVICVLSNQNACFDSQQISKSTPATQYVKEDSTSNGRR